MPPSTAHLLIMAIITAACGLPLGLRMRSAAEIKSGYVEPCVFGLHSALGFTASMIVKLMEVLVLFFVPSLLLLHLLGHEPCNNLDAMGWWLSNYMGVGIGKWIRWLRWRRTQDFM